MGHTDVAITEMRTSLERQSAMQSLIERSHCLTLLAEALFARGAYDEAARLCDEALDFTARTECRSYEPETHRIKGEVLLAVGEDSRLQEAAGMVASALLLARASGCRLLELSAAKSSFRISSRLGD
jgi:hypothetical protein